MRNIITHSSAKLIPQAALALPGIATHGVALGLAATFEATLHAEKEALTLADAAYEQGRLARQKAFANQRAAIRKARTHLRMVRELMRPRLTATYSQSWDALGFTGSLRLPRSVNKMVTALNKMGSHLAAHPDLGAEDAHLVAERTVALETNLVDVATALNGCKAEVQRLYAARKVAAGKVRLLLREVLSVLHLKLSPLDARWVEFGFQKPGARPTPDAPVEVTAEMISPSTMMVKWPATARARYYRVWKRVEGVDQELVAAGNTSELSFVIEQVPERAWVEGALSAVNDNGESVRSDTVRVQPTPGRIHERGSVPEESGTRSIKTAE